MKGQEGFCLSEQTLHTSERERLTGCTYGLNYGTACPSLQAVLVCRPERDILPVEALLPSSFSAVRENKETRIAVVISGNGVTSQNLEQNTAFAAAGVAYWDFSPRQGTTYGGRQGHSATDGQHAYRSRQLLPYPGLRNADATGGNLRSPAQPRPSLSHCAQS